MAKITLHRALAELKMIEKKLEKKLTSFHPIGGKQGDLPVNGVYDESEFVQKAKSDYQSIQDTITRQAKLKAAVAFANVTNEVEVAGETMTIAAAITRKSLIENERKVLKEMKAKRQALINSMTRHNEKVEQNAKSIAEAALSGPDSFKSLEDANVVAITKPYLETNRITLVDPLGLTAEIDKLEEAIDTFEAEVDAALSEVNATTSVEV